MNFGCHTLIHSTILRRVPLILVWLDGKCLDITGSEQKDGVQSKHKQYWSSRDKCLAECKKWDKATGCQFRKDEGCWVHTKDVAAGSGKPPYICAVFSSKTLNVLYLLLSCKKTILLAQTANSLPSLVSTSMEGEMLYSESIWISRGKL